MEPRLRSLLNSNQTLNYKGRKASASPATGIGKVHKKELELLLKSPFEF